MVMVMKELVKIGKDMGIPNAIILRKKDLISAIMGEPYKSEHLCQHDDCNKQASFNDPWEKRGKFCARHKEENMVSVKEKSCQHNNCNKKPMFNDPWEKRGKFCFAHKGKNMIDVVNRKCQYENCEKIPNFNDPWETRGKFCFAHKGKNMIDVKHDRCQHRGCLKRSTYGTKGLKPLFCVKHRAPIMVDLVNKSCSFEDCCVKPNFNNPGETKGKFCFAHKDPDMIDVAHVKCDHCVTRASYGMPGNGPSKCFKHRNKNMMVNPRKICQHEGCRELGLYSTYNITERYCEDHKPDDTYKNVIEFRCKSCGLLEVINEDKLCTYCRPRNKDPNRAEIKVLNFVHSLEDIKFDFVSHDKVVNQGECIMTRPDILFEHDSKTFMLAIEVDEGQHRSYQEVCECIRMANLSQALYKPTVFLRINPDGYTSKGKRMATTLNARLKVLHRWIKYLGNKSIEELGYMSMVKLFFDEYEPTNTPIVQVTSFDDEEE